MFIEPYFMFSRVSQKGIMCEKRKKVTVLSGNSCFFKKREKTFKKCVSEVLPYTVGQEFSVNKKEKKWASHF